MHNAPVIVGHVEGARAAGGGLIEVDLGAGFHISPVDLDIVIPFAAILFVHESQGVHELMDDRSGLLNAPGDLQIDLLFTTHSPHTGPAATVFTRYCDVILFTCPRREFNAGLRMILIDGIFNPTHLCCIWNGKNGIKYGADRGEASNAH